VPILGRIPLWSHSCFYSRKVLYEMSCFLFYQSPKVGECFEKNQKKRKFMSANSFSIWHSLKYYALFVTLHFYQLFFYCTYILVQLLDRTYEKELNKKPNSLLCFFLPKNSTENKNFKIICLIWIFLFLHKCFD
jgi:hypothetical protein